MSNGLLLGAVRTQCHNTTERTAGVDYVTRAKVLTVQNATYSLLLQDSKLGEIKGGEGNGHERTR